MLMASSCSFDFHGADFRRDGRGNAPGDHHAGKHRPDFGDERLADRNPEVSHGTMNPLNWYTACVTVVAPE